MLWMEPRRFLVQFDILLAKKKKKVVTSCNTTTNTHVHSIPFHSQIVDQSALEPHSIHTHAILHLGVPWLTKKPQGQQ